MSKPTLTPVRQKAAAELRERITKLRARLPKGNPKAAFVGTVLNALPAVYEAVLAGSLPHALKAGARLIYAMGLAGFATAQEKAQANAFLSEPMH